MWKKRLSLAALIGVSALVAGCATAGGSSDKTASRASSPKAALTGSAAPVQKPAKPTSYAATDIELCPRMTISNSPHADSSGIVRSGPYVKINGVSLLLEPATNVCLSSGYGQRSGRPHRGVDYHTRTDGDVVAASDGAIIEAVFRPDFGNMIVIDHGAGVYTRYAHLQSFAGSVKAGATIKRGQKLGQIGATGSTSVKHLHFEILTGKYIAGVGSFGLASHDPFALESVKTAAAAIQMKPQTAP